MGLPTNILQHTSVHLLKASKTFTYKTPMAFSSHCLFPLCLALLMAMAAATQFRVGGSMGWTVPTDPNAVSYNQWAERNRFQIGDSLLFVYPPERDSVLQVTQDAYSTCNASSYVQRFDDGNTVFTFNQPGPHYFISGDENNCLRNESMVVIVMADRSNRGGSSGPNVAPAAPPSPPPTTSLPSSPPSPPPSPTEAPPPPATEVTPSPAPAGESSPPPPNGASVKVVELAGSIGALLGSLLCVF